MNTVHQKHLPIEIELEAVGEHVLERNVQLPRHRLDQRLETAAHQVHVDATQMQQGDQISVGEKISVVSLRN